MEITDLVNLRRNICVSLQHDEFPSFFSRELYFNNHTISARSKFFVCCGKKYKKSQKRLLLDHVFMPTEPPQILLDLILAAIPQPIAEEIVPHLSGLPMRSYMTSRSANYVRPGNNLPV